MSFNIKYWNNEYLGKEVSFDAETNMAPWHERNHKIVTFQVCGSNSPKDVYFVEKKDLRSFLTKHYSSKLIAHNTKFDMLTLSHEVGWDILFRFYDNNRVYDTQIMFQLYTLATEGFIPYEGISLAKLTSQFFGIELSKEMDIRGGFEQFKDTPTQDIPREFLEYAAGDAYYTLLLYNRLSDLIKTVDTTNQELSLHIQMKGDLALDQIYKNGVQVDLKYAMELYANLEGKQNILEGKLAMWGLVPGRPGLQNDYENAMKSLGIDSLLPRSPKSNKLSAKEEDLRAFSYIPFVKDYLEYQSLHKTKSFLTGLKHERIHPKYQNLLVTGRTSCSGSGDMGGGINIQQLPKEGGIRECFIPKDGHVFVDVDYSAIEMSTLAQTLIDLYGSCKMSEYINEGKDLHTVLATYIYGKDGGDLTKENRGEITTKERNFSKIGNFGLGANMAADTFVGHAGKQGVQITLADAEKTKEAFETMNPEMAEYYREMYKHHDGYGIEGKKTFRHTSRTGRVKANCSYSAWLNLGFQGLAADGLKLALYELFKKGYVVVMEVHDQIVVEVEKSKAEVALREVSDIMISSMRKLVPDVAVATEGAIRDRYCK